MTTNKYFVLGVDPSGAFKEGNGTTGYALLNNVGKPVAHCYRQAKDYPDRMSYFKGVVDQILSYKNRIPEGYRLVVALEDFVLYKRTANSLVNSEMETSKLVGVIEFKMWELGIICLRRNASEVVNRWNDKILLHKGVLTGEQGKRLLCAGTPIISHSKDALRHAVHCYTFELKKLED